MNLNTIINNPELIEIARKAIEDEAIEMRDSRIGIINRANGIVVKEQDGSPSSIIRIPTDQAVIIALQAIAKHLDTTS